MDTRGIGIDSAEIQRFQNLDRRDDTHFFTRVFSEGELDYCFSYTDPAPHLASMFAVKEAVRKVYGDEPVTLSAIEVRHCASGKPEIWMNGTRSQTLLVSITHDTRSAIAVAFNQPL
ncbi:MAG: holo-ACP synthase [Candidatus Paceibacterota bacterium]|jgi:holo-[acyl-carrier protein] synthase